MTQEVEQWLSHLNDVDLHVKQALDMKAIISKNWPNGELKDSYLKEIDDFFSGQFTYDPIIDLRLPDKIKEIDSRIESLCLHVNELEDGISTTPKDRNHGSSAAVLISIITALVVVLYWTFGGT